MAAEALEQSVLESKDKDQLLAIAKALGVKASARTKKSDIIDQILETTGSPSRAADQRRACSAAGERRRARTATSTAPPSTRPAAGDAPTLDPTRPATTSVDARP